ncbi:MAG: CheR family methyltransferase [Telluria sp.]
MSARDILRRATGLALDGPALERALHARMRELGITQAADYMQLLAGPELDQLAELVVVPESWMFRDPAAFKAATALVERRLARNAGAVARILSVPCAGGEEPYSMAMALADAGIDRERYLIDAVDLSAASIRRARAARYKRHAFRGAELAFRDRYFTRDGDAFVLRDEERSAVRFRQGNLLALDLDANAGRYDVIFCRNLLIYFDDEAIERAARVLSALLADGGLLLAGPAETPALCRHGFQRLPLPGAFALHKPGQPPMELASDAGGARRLARQALQRLPAKAAPAAPAPQAEPVGHLLAQAQRQADSGQLREAADACRHILGRTPTEARAWFILGLVSQCEGDAVAAESNWRRCLYLDPCHYEVLCALALLAEQSGDARRAALYRHRAVRARPADERSCA